MQQLTSSQRSQLKRLAHDLRPLVQIGKNGLTDQLRITLDNELTAHELVKIKFMAFQEERAEITRELVEATASAQVAMIGNTAILFREHPDPAKRKIKLDT
jgi:RNA-binding protein